MEMRPSELPSPRRMRSGFRDSQARSEQAIARIQLRGPPGTRLPEGFAAPCAQSSILPQQYVSVTNHDHCGSAKEAYSFLTEKA